jgi:ComF family protein
MRNVVETITRIVAHALSEARCAACDAHLDREAVFCSPCAATWLPAAPASLPVAGAESLRIHAAALYGGAIATAINRFKHRDRPDLARQLGDLVRADLRRRPEGARVDMVVPVPLHRARLADRGYNHAGLLARAVARELDVPARYALLRRTRPTRPQQGLGAAARRRNLAGAFAARNGVRGRSILLVDDVSTTGATLRACAEALRGAGATRVNARVVALRGVGDEWD